MSYFDIILIGIACVCVTDLSGFVQSIEAAATRYTGKRCRLPKPLSCSMCMTHWIGLFGLLLTHTLTLCGYVVLLLISISTPLIREAIMTVQDMILAGIRQLQKLT